MSVTIRLRKIDCGTTNATSLITQQASGPSPRAYYLKHALVDAGWVVYYSSNGLAPISNMGDGITSGQNTSDNWTTSTFQAIMTQFYIGGADALHTMDGIWCCLRSPNVDANYEYLHICLSPTGAQWYNPTVRGATNDANTYAVNAKSSPYTWLNGQSHGYIRLGMTLSANKTAFSGGSAVPSSGATSATARGDLPIATGTIWTTHNMGGNSGSAGYFPSLTVVTDGNQFHVIQDTGANTVSNRSWWSLCSLVNGGYGVIEQGILNTSSTSLFRGISLVGGRKWNNVSLSSATNDIPTELGGWRSAYVKAVGGVVINGGLANPEPPGWEAAIDQPYYTTGNQFPNVMRLRAISCTDTANYDLGNFSDFVMLGDTRIADNDRIIKTDTLEQWFVYKDSNAYLLKWDWLDNPALRTVV